MQSFSSPSSQTIFSSLMCYSFPSSALLPAQMTIKHLFSELTNPHSSLVFSIKVQVWLRQNICTLFFSFKSSVVGSEIDKFIFHFSVEKNMASFDHISERVRKILGSISYSQKCLLSHARSNGAETRFLVK